MAENPKHEDPNWRPAVEFMGQSVVMAMDSMAGKVGASNKLVAHATMWAALQLAQRDLGGPGVCEWLRDNADLLEAGIMGRNPCQPLN